MNCDADLFYNGAVTFRFHRLELRTEIYQMLCGLVGHLK